MSRVRSHAPSRDAIRRITRPRPRRLAALALLIATAGCLPDTSQELVDGQRIEARWRIGPFPWSVVVDGVDRALEAEPGAEWRVDYTLDVDLRAHEARHGTFTGLALGIRAERRHDADGHFRSGGSTLAVSSSFTAGGVPVERFDGWPRFRLIHGVDGTPFEAVAWLELPADGDVAARHHFEGTLTAALPDDIAHGHYEPTVHLYAVVEGIDQPVPVATYGWGWGHWWSPTLPLVRVGEPAPPRLPWTLLPEYATQGRAGTLSLEDAGRVELLGRSGFPEELILPPGSYPTTPGLPTLFPRMALPPIDGGYTVMPGEIPHFLQLDEGVVRCVVHGPSGSVDLGERGLRLADAGGVQLDGGEFVLDLSETGEYEIRLEGTLLDRFGRSYGGGGRYELIVARPLTFSTSCKPGTSFLVGESYPPKVNVLPPFPADVEVEVRYQPDGADEPVVWEVAGTANRFGHFDPTDGERLRFDAPGEYVSVVRARHVDGRGALWAGEQTSTGVIAPQDPVIRLQGAPSLPFHVDWEDRAHFGAAERFGERTRIGVSFLQETPYVMQDPFVPVHAGDTLFVPTSFSEENMVEPQLVVTVDDPALGARLTDLYRESSQTAPVFCQPYEGDWQYLDDVVRTSTDSFAWFPADGDGPLPVRSVGRDGLHPSVDPGAARLTGYTILGVVRPGFPVMTSAFESEALGFYWAAAPNRFGNHFGTGLNGDLPGDVYRIQAGATLEDRDTGERHRDAYASTIAVGPRWDSPNANAIVAPGDRPLAVLNGREHRLLLGIDTHDVLEVGESIALGGMVFPAVEADVRWTVTRPDGEVVEVRGRATRLGIVRGERRVPADLPGLYRVAVDVRHDGLRGDVLGTTDGSYWHVAVDEPGRGGLRSGLAAHTAVDPIEGLRIPLSWREELRDVRLHFATLIPGQVLDQGAVEPAGASWSYPFEPLELARQFPNFEVSDFGDGSWRGAETVVLQFVLEARDDEGPVWDVVRLVHRRGLLIDHAALQADAPACHRGGPPGSDDPPLGHPGTGHTSGAPIP